MVFYTNITLDTFKNITTLLNAEGAHLEVIFTKSTFLGLRIACWTARYTEDPITLFTGHCTGTANSKHHPDTVEEEEELLLLDH